MPMTSSPGGAAGGEGGNNQDNTGEEEKEEDSDPYDLLDPVDILGKFEKTYSHSPGVYPRGCMQRDAI